MCPSCVEAALCALLSEIPSRQASSQVCPRTSQQNITFISQVGWEDTNFQQPPCSKPVLVLPCRFAYKDEYEKFKLYLTIILLIVSFSCRFLLNSR